MRKLFDAIFQNNVTVFLFLLCFCVICYINVVKGPFLFDDEHFIEKNEFVHNFDVAKIYTSSVTQGAQLGDNFYRPNQQFVFSGLYKIFGLNPIPFHLTSIFLHLLNAFLLFLLLIKLSFERITSAIIALLFMIHPVQTEAVSYISGLADPLGFMMVLSGLNILVKANNASVIKWLYLFFSSILFIGALFTKESMLVFVPLAILIIIYLLIIEKKKLDLYHVLSFVVFTLIGITYLWLKLTVFNFSDSIGLTEEKNIYTEHFIIRLITFVSVLPNYLGLIFWPIHLNYEKPYLAYIDPFTWQSLVGFFFIAVFIFSIIKAHKMPKLFLGLAWFFCAMLPFVGIIPLNAMFLEHWLYIPIIGVLICMAAVIEMIQWKMINHVVSFLLVLIILLFSAKTIARNNQWNDIERFYLNELKYTKDSIRVLNNLGMHYADKKNFEKAISYYKKAILLGDKYPQPHHNIAEIYIQQGLFDQAIAELYGALAVEPQFIYSWKSLNSLYNYMGDEDRARQTSFIIERIQKGEKIDAEQVRKIQQ